MDLIGEASSVASDNLLLSLSLSLWLGFSFGWV